jgi:hypothetical protein
MKNIFFSNFFQLKVKTKSNDFTLSIPFCVLQYTKIMLNTLQSNANYFSGGNMFRLTNKSLIFRPSGNLIDQLYIDMITSINTSIYVQLVN